MLDRLLGRASLKERVAELEEENHHLERQLDAEKERRADAATERQRAEAEVNRLEDRVAELQDRVERLQDEEGESTFRAEETLSRSRLSEVLDRLESFETEPEASLLPTSTGSTPCQARSGMPSATARRWSPAPRRAWLLRMTQAFCRRVCPSPRRRRRSPSGPTPFDWSGRGSSPPASTSSR